MIPEIGHFALILALCAALVQGTFPLIGAHRGIGSWIGVAKPAAQAQFLFLVVAYACLTYSFIIHDFSVLYVASTSNSQLPLLYRISGVWGAHEGSLLLWAVILAVWTAAVTAFSRSIPKPMLARVIGVMGLISVGFLLFILLTSNPFERLFPGPPDGRDLNPLLQDPGLAIHPPMLYMGYVGFSVAFAFAIAALLSGKLDSAWARWMRPWTNVAWLFLTVGIALGSWWAYYELGWGGWWFWDPVENASFMPWIVGTALIHSLAATEKRGAFKSWTVLLAVFAFSLSLLGTFLVRSGVLTSVHAFATDPARGVFILAFLVVVIGGSLALYAWRGPKIVSTGGYGWVSREAGLLFNNVLLVVVCSTILLGTLYPLALDALGMGKISVGPPYFNSVFVPLTVPLALMVGVGALARWKKDNLVEILKRLGWAAGLSLVGAFSLPFAMGEFDWSAALGIGLGLWITLGTMQGVIERLRHRQNKLAALGQIPGSFWGMSLAHLGIAMFAVGVALTSVYSVEKDLRMAPGEQYEIDDYRFVFDGVEQVAGPNYRAFRGTVNVESLSGDPITELHAEKRTYLVQRMPMTEAGIDAGFTRDLYLALGEPLDDGSWSLRLYHKPFIRWIWLGGLLMALGGLVAASDKRYRQFARRAEAASDHAAATA
jgi:cytochrome c-type biogenesis protein CcmF